MLIMPESNHKRGDRDSRLYHLSAEHAALSWEKQLALAERLGPGPWRLDIACWPVIGQALGLALLIGGIAGGAK